MLKPCIFEAWLSVALLVPGAGVVSGQDYPNKPIRIVTTPSGGGVDFAARLIAPGLSDNLGQPTIVENRGGVVIAGEIVSRASPDGYTLLFIASPLWLSPLMQDKVPFDPVKDFSPISLTNTQPAILVVNPSLPVKSVKELIALAKSKPGELNYASGAIGSITHLGTELFKAMAGVNIVHIPYKGSGPAVTDLIGGQVQLMITTPSSVAPHIKSGRLRAVAITSAKPSALFPGLPTVAATGLPGYEASSITGMFAPAKTPAKIINRLSQEIARVLDRTDVKEKFFNTGVETVGSSPEQFMTVVKSDIARMGKVIKDAGIRELGVSVR